MKAGMYYLQCMQVIIITRVRVKKMMTVVVSCIAMLGTIH